MYSWSHFDKAYNPSPHLKPTPATSSLSVCQRRVRKLSCVSELAHVISSLKGRSRGSEGLRSGDDSFCSWVEGVTSGAVTVTQGRVGSVTGRPVNESKSVNDTTWELKTDDDNNSHLFFL